MRPASAPALHSQRIKLAFANVAGITSCGYRHSLKPHPEFRSRQILAEPTHVLYPMIRERMEHRDPNDLWISVSANTMVAKKVVRVKLQRRIRAALYEVMKERGFDINGRRIENGQPGLVGSLSIIPLGALLKIGHEQLKSEMRLVVDRVQDGPRQRSTAMASEKQQPKGRALNKSPSKWTSRPVRHRNSNVA